MMAGETAKAFSMREYGRGGSSNTTNNTGFRAKDFVAVAHRFAWLSM